MAISNPSLPSVPDGVHVDELTLDVGTLTITARTTAPRGLPALRAVVGAVAQRVLANPE